MDWGLRGSPLFVCLLLVFAEKASFSFFLFVFFTMPSAPQQERPALSVRASPL